VRKPLLNYSVPADSRDMKGDRKRSREAVFHRLGSTLGQRIGLDNATKAVPIGDMRQGETSGGGF